MFIFIKILQEGIFIAIQELWANKLRTFLSLMGISIGIFCIISVWTVTDSFEQSLKSSFARLGDDVLYVTRESWTEDPTLNWWKYVRRPYANYQEFKAIKNDVSAARAVTIRVILMGQELKAKNGRVDNIPVVGASYDFKTIFDLEFQEGRYVTPGEAHIGSNYIMLGNNLATELFPYAPDPTGKHLKFKGRVMTVIGVLEKEGQSLLGDGMDNVAIVPYNYLRKYIDINSKRLMPLIAVKAAEGVGMEQLKDELTGVLRASRKLKPKEGNNFELNQMSLLTSLLDSLFAMLWWAGLFIGGLSLIVGAFGIANIMFVSVKERTKLIGIKKSIGAKQVYILFEFLTEAVILTVFGGLLGLVFVYLLTLIMGGMVDSFDLFLSTNNIVWGVGISVIIGLVSGIIPAIRASSLDPVEAIRQ